MVTSCPTGSKNPNSSLAVSEPRKTTAAADDWSAASRKRPSDTDRPRTGSQDGTVPVTVVVQFADPLTSSCELLCDTGATPATSGAAALEFSASASPVVSVVADPKPDRTPEVVELPGETISRFPPSAASCLLTR